MSVPIGGVLWKGKSRIDGSPIVAIITYASSNRGTGDMAQTWILRSDVAPVEAIKRNLDIAICGQCPLRPVFGKGGACYVNACHGPQPIFHAFKSGRYPIATDHDLRYHLRMKPVRLGAYGDPCAVPIRVWNRLLKYAPMGHTGYTHQWQELKNRNYSAILMASVESESGAIKAQSQGWRTFRVYAPGSPLMPQEIRCPKSEDIDPMQRRDCVHCKACDGSDRPGKRNVAILLHGSPPKVGNGKRILATV